MTSVALPVELVEQILFLCWVMPLSIDERITLMTSAALINSTWRAIFLRVSSRDVHIPCPSFADHFLRILRPDSLPNRLCRSLTIQIINKTCMAEPVATESPMEKALSRLLYRFHDASTPPFLIFAISPSITTTWVSITFSKTGL
ncbi:hypothetical protein B0H19DRAFT_506118 [Mycena capillaripes]|nr:hypothetical protein B0H19DRAFT_506118 [Mycena capillaripes]